MLRFHRNTGSLADASARAADRKHIFPENDMFLFDRRRHHSLMSTPRNFVVGRDSQITPSDFQVASLLHKAFETSTGSLKPHRMPYLATQRFRIKQTGITHLPSYPSRCACAIHEHRNIHVQKSFRMLLCPSLMLGSLRRNVSLPESSQGTERSQPLEHPIMDIPKHCSSRCRHL